MKFLVPILLLLSACGHANWTTGDTARQGALAALQVADWSQTRTIATQKTNQTVIMNLDGGTTTYSPQHKYQEANPLLGERPSRGEVDLYFAGLIAGHTLVSYLLPPKWRAAWQYISIGFQGAVVYHNYQMGVGIEF